MDDNYLAAPDRYQRQPYRAAGRHGLRLPGIGLGLWHNFGAGSDPATAKAMVHQAFDLGITHFDLANNYGPPPGSAELTFGTLLKRSLAPYRDELIIASKAGPSINAIGLPAPSLISPQDLTITLLTLSGMGT